VERAQAAMPGFVLTEKNAPAVLQVCRRLDGIPLAIELATARLRALSIEQIAERLDDRFRLLTSGSRGALPRQQTLRGTLDWSYQLLSDPERVLMRRLSVFAGGWSLEAAEGVCASGASVEYEVLSVKGDASGPEALTPNTQHSTLPLAEGDVLDLLASLVEKSLVICEVGKGGARYGLLETVRQYFGERLREAGDEDATRERHLEYFLALAETAEQQMTGGGQAEWLERLDTELDNLRMALDGAAGPRQSAPGSNAGATESRPQ